MGERAVLVVEEDPAAVRTLRAALNGHAVTLEVASTAQAAVNVLGGKPICGVLLDVAIGDSDGMEVLEYVEREQLPIPVVVVAPRLSPAMRDRLTDEHVKLIVAKPVEARLLATIVLGLCGIRS